MAQYGIDISKWQNGIDVTVVPSDFVIVKATEGVGYTDPNFNDFYSTLKSINKQRGVYHFARPDLGNPPENEANWFLQTARQAIGDGILVLDFEQSGGDYVAWCLQWLNHVKTQTGVTPLFYTYTAIVNARDWSPIANAEYPLWLANYGANDGNEGPEPSVRYWDSYVMWQFTSKGQLSGWGGNLDRNKFYGDATTWQELVGQGTPPEPLPSFGGAGVLAGL